MRQEVGNITVGGRVIGVITMTRGDAADDSTPDLGGYEHAGRDWQSGLAPSRPHAHGHAAHLSDRAHHHTTRAADDHVGESLHGSAYLAARRERFATEMRDNPEVREQVAGMLLTEGANDPVPVAESLMNRMDFTGGSLQGGLHSGFYGPIRRGELPGAIEHLRRNPELKAQMDHAIDAALHGSNLIHGATDQGMASDPNGEWQGGRIERGNNVYNDWAGHGGHASAAAYRENLMRHVEQEGAQASTAEPPSDL